MINVRVIYNDTAVNINFPCDSNVLEAKLMELHVEDQTNALMFIEKIEGVSGLEFMENNFVDIDELNLLANKLNCFDNREMQKFEAVVGEYNIRNMAELINLTSNMHRYNLIQDMSSAEKIGRTHYMTRNIGMTEEESKTLDFAKIGKELVNSGMGRLTEYGMLFESHDIPSEITYDGIPAPENLNGDKLVEISVTADNNKIHIWLPETKNTINRILKRLNTNIDSTDYKAEFQYYEGENQEWRERLKEILTEYGFNTLNRVVSAINCLGAEKELEKLEALMEYAETTEPEDIIKLAKNIDKFGYIPGATEYSDMAQHVIDDLEDYHISIELHDYFDDAKFGEDQMEERNARFVDDGIVYMKDNYTLQQILGHNEGQGMSMGGM